VGVEKFRRKGVFGDGLTVTGSARFSGGRTDFAGAVGVGGVLAVNTIPEFQANSSATPRFAGKTTVGCGQTNFVASTTAVKSTSMIFYGLDFRAAAAVAQASSLGPWVTQAIADGVSFRAGWVTSANAIPNNQIDVSWFILNQG